MPNQLQLAVQQGVEAYDDFYPTPLRILVADGNADAADSLALLLPLWGHEVVVARTGPDALDAAQGYRPDVLLAEVVLPGINGFDLATRLRNEHPAGTVLVALTVMGDPTSSERVRRAGYHHHLVKPVAPDELQGLLDSIRPTRSMTPGLEAPSRLAVAG